MNWYGYFFVSLVVSIFISFIGRYILERKLKTSFEGLAMGDIIAFLVIIICALLLIVQEIIHYHK